LGPSFRRDVAALRDAGLSVVAGQLDGYLLLCFNPDFDAS
jgi:hypothetical protein